MVFKKAENGKWILKRKFTFAAVVLTVITVFAFRGFVLATTVAEFSMLMTAYATASGGVLLLIFGADIADKSLNGGRYSQNDDYNDPRYGDPRL